MSERRKYLTPRAKAAVRFRQNDKCAECGKELSDPIEFDHRLPLWAGGTNDLSNFDALCKKPCHQKRTSEAAPKRAKADRQRTFQETGHGRTHHRKAWASMTFSGGIKRG